MGGTILGSARCAEFRTPEGRAGARGPPPARGGRPRRHRGSGSQAGAASSEAGLPCVGIASTIDNDLYGSDITIGVDTALNIALEAIDRLKTTASSHGRAFLVQVMGRDCGYLAPMPGIAGGAEAVVVPEVPVDPEVLARDLDASRERGKKHAIVVVAEGASFGAEGLARYFQEHKKRLGFDLRVTILGHVQRGGAPGAYDRLRDASRVRGRAAARRRRVRNPDGTEGREDRLDAPFRSGGHAKPLDPSLFELARVMAS